jgi:hypothetical protein
MSETALKTRRENPSQPNAAALRTALRELDDGIESAIRFGSSVYMPDLAEDTDLAIITGSQPGKFGAAEFGRGVDRFFSRGMENRFGGVRFDCFVGDSLEHLRDRLGEAWPGVVTGRALFSNDDIETRMAPRATETRIAAAQARDTLEKSLAAADRSFRTAIKRKSLFYKAFHAEHAFEHLFRAARAAHQLRIIGGSARPDEAPPWLRELMSNLHRIDIERDRPELLDNRNLSVSYRFWRLNTSLSINHVLVGGNGMPKYKSRNIIYALRMGEAGDRRLHIHATGTSGTKVYIVDEYLNIITT